MSPKRSPGEDVTNTTPSSATPRPRHLPFPSTSSSSVPQKLKQASIFEMFNPQSSATSSPAPSLIFDAPLPPTSDSSIPTSPCVASSVCDEEEEDVEMDDDDHSRRAARRAGKRARGREEVEEEVDEEDARPQLLFRFSAKDGERKMKSLYNTPGKQIGVHAMLQKRGLGLKAGMKQVSMRPFLRDLVSSNEEQVFRCRSEHPTRMWAPPFALQYSKGAKAGGRQLFAVADEEGTVGFINAGETSQYDNETGRTSFKAHSNAIFDVAWNEDDSMLVRAVPLIRPAFLSNQFLLVQATASGDQTVKLWDVETRTCTGVLSGHTCTIKNVTWDPFNPHMLATASRDGSIRIWDRRVQGQELSGAAGPSVDTVNMIKNAHGTKGKGAKGRSATKSVTSVAYLKHSENLLASSGSSDRQVTPYALTIKVWDLRKSHKRRVNPEHLESNEDAVADAGTARPHGISNMALSPNGQKIFALSTDHRIYAFDPLNLTQPAPLGIYSHPESKFNSFYVRLALSPCSRYLAAGNSDGAIHVWDTEGNGKDAVRVIGHEREVSGLDWGHETSDEAWLASQVGEERLDRDGVNEEGPRGGGGGGDDDVNLPKATVAKLIQELLPPDFTCAKEAKDLMTECCKENPKLTYLVYLVSVARLAALIPPKIASPAVAAGGSASRMATVVDFYSKLPKGAIEKKSAGFSPIAQYKARYFSGDNASGAPFIHAIGVLFLVGYTIGQFTLSLGLHMAGLQHAPQGMARDLVAA
ncbi:denticleless, partial [Phenoliferia sp. Uapishka_3]